MVAIDFFEELWLSGEYGKLSPGVQKALNIYFMAAANGESVPTVWGVDSKKKEQNLRETAECLAKNGIGHVLITRRNKNPFAVVKAFCDAGWQIEGVSDVSGRQRTAETMLAMKYVEPWVCVDLVCVGAEGERGRLNQFALMLTDDEAARLDESNTCAKDVTKEILQSRICKWLSTKAGWKIICRSYGCLNLSDAISLVSLSEIGCRQETSLMCSPIKHVQIEANPDELLAPRNIPVFLLGKLPDGGKLEFAATADFLDGSVEKPREFASSHCVPWAIRLENGDEIRCRDDGMDGIELIAASFVLVNMPGPSGKMPEHCD